MEIFNKIEGFNNKVNFADKNNVCVGYSLKQHCCENAGWFISNKRESTIYDDNHNKIERPTPDVLDFVFDREFFETVKCSQLELGKMVCFRLISGNKELFLHLYNCQNGYYGHGFNFTNNDSILVQMIL